MMSSFSEARAGSKFSLFPSSQAESETPRGLWLGIWPGWGISRLELTLRPSGCSWRLPMNSLPSLPQATPLYLSVFHLILPVAGSSWVFSWCVWAFLQLSGLLDHCYKTPQVRWFTLTEMYSLTVQETRYWQGWFPGPSLASSSYHTLLIPLA